MPQKRYAPRPSDGAMVLVEAQPGSAPVYSQTKAGTPVDADLVAGAVDGQDIVIDTAALKIWVRIAGTWRFAQLT